jgi:hypothetical protein
VDHGLRWGSRGRVAHDYRQQRLQEQALSNDLLEYCITFEDGV